MKKIFAFAALAVATFTGAAFAAEGYSISVQAGKGKANEKVTSVITVKSQGVYHINKEYPHKAVLTAPDGVSVDAKVKGSVNSETELTFVVVSTSAGTGKKDIAAEVKFAVCTDSTCEPKVEKVTLSVDAK